MLDKTQTCTLVHDLLPLYVEKLTTEESNKIIKEHLAECSYCRGSYEMMKKEMTEDKRQESSLEETASEIDYLKKIRAISRKKIGFAIGGTVIAFAIGIIFKVFVWGTPTQNYTVALNIQEGNIKIQGVLEDGKTVYSHYRVVEKNGEKQLLIYGARSILWHRDKSFEIEYPLEKLENKGFNMADKKITKAGNIVSTYAAQIYEAKHPYIGNPSENNELARAIGIATDLGGYTNELKTDEKPYKWCLNFEAILEGPNETLFNEKMQRYAMVLLACVDNLDEVEWSYKLNEGEQTSTKKHTLSINETRQTLDTDIKEYGKSEEGIQALLIRTGIL